MKWAVFDLEFTELLPHEDTYPWAENVHISCASIMCTGDASPFVWYDTIDGTIQDYMSTQSTVRFIEKLEELSQNYFIVSWGGSASDFRMLAKESGLKDRIVALTLKSYDIPLMSFVQQGFMIGLLGSMKALGLDLKTDKASENIPALWKGTLQDKHIVLQHVSNDSFATLLVITQAEASGMMPWVSKYNDYSVWSPFIFLSVKECLVKEIPILERPSKNAKELAKWMFY